MANRSSEFRFRVSHQEGQKHPRRRKRAAPPNYYSWQSRWKLLIPLAAIMLGLTVVERLMRTPTAGSAQVATPPLTETEIAREEVETIWQPVPSEDGSSEEPTIEARPARSPLAVASAPTDQSQWLALATAERWASIRGELNAAERGMLRKLLQVSRSSQRLADDEPHDWPQLSQRLEELWSRYHHAAQAAGAPLSPEESVRWAAVLEEMQSIWNAQLQPALSAVAEGRPLSDGEQASLARLQSDWDRLALAEVRDNTVFRPAEQEAWFRLFEKLQTTDPLELENLSAGRIGFLQLFKQPREYRGQLVTIRGTARLGQRVDAPKNPNGIPGYYVLWVKPLGGPNRAFVVYTLELPPGFPELPEKDPDGQMTSLDEPVEFTGYFFKNWAYQAVDQTRVAPVLLAKAPRWQPDAAPPSAAASAPFMAEAPVQRSAGASSKSAAETMRREPAIPLPGRLPGSARELLINVDDSELQQLADRQPLTGNDEETLVKILYRLPAYRLDEVELLAPEEIPWQRLLDDPNAERAEIFHLSGYATHATRQPLNPELAARVEFDHYYQVTFESDEAPYPIMVCARKVPQAWPLDQPLRERSALYGVFLKVGDVTGPHPQLVFAADRVAWYPSRDVSRVPVTPDQSLLAALGFDVGLLEDVQKTNGRAITASDREPFYQMLAAVGRADSTQLLTQSRSNIDLPALLQRPDEHHGELAVVEGVARRITKILVDDPDIRQRFQIDHYYEIDLFTSLGDQLIRIDASDAPGTGPIYANNYSVTVCVRRLPPELMAASDARQRLRIPACFFKLWAYRSEYTESFNTRLAQPSPLFIALEPQVIPPPPLSNPVSDVVMLMAALTLGGVGLGAWWYGRLKPKSPRYGTSRHTDHGPDAARDEPDFSGLA